MRRKITMNAQKDVTIKEAYELFIRKAKVRNLGEYTLKTYGYHYDAFTSYFDEEKSIDKVTPDTVDGFIIFLREHRQVNETTINSYLRTIRTFLYYCMECGYMQSFKIKMIKTEKKIKETYTDAELERLLAKPNLKKCTFIKCQVLLYKRQFRKVNFLLLAPF